MVKPRFSIFTALPARIVGRLFTEPARRRRYLLAEREFNANCDRLAWLLAEAYVNALSFAADNLPIDDSASLLPEKKAIAAFWTLIARQEKLMETMRENLSARTEMNCWGCMARYDGLLKVIELFPEEDALQT